MTLSNIQTDVSLDEQMRKVQCRDNNTVDIKIICFVLLLANDKRGWGTVVKGYSCTKEPKLLLLVRLPVVCDKKNELVIFWTHCLMEVKISFKLDALTCEKAAHKNSICHKMVISGRTLKKVSLDLNVCCPLPAQWVYVRLESVGINN